MPGSFLTATMHLFPDKCQMLISQILQCWDPGGGGGGGAEVIAPRIFAASQNSMPLPLFNQALGSVSYLHKGINNCHS